MVRITSKVYVGTLEDYENVRDDGDFFAVIAAKEPYHRQALGYTGRSCGKEHPEYLYAERENCLICNLVDASSAEYISDTIISKALKSIDNAVENGKRVLICCNQGRSRSAGIGLLYLRHSGYFETEDFETAENFYRNYIYTAYGPANGIRSYVERHWNTTF